MAISKYIADDAAYAPDRYYKYAELTQLLLDWQERYPAFLSIESIGKSYEGRDIWGVTLTNAKTGPADEKPAYHIDANIHAGEVIGSGVVLYTIHWLLTNYGSNDRATYLLDHTTVYCVPRISVDGAELYLTTPVTLRSSVRPYPDEDERDGLKRKDMDGDGSITMMRVRDAAGTWKKSAQDDRLMVKRAPDEIVGEFYRVYPEGELTTPPDGAGVTVLRPAYGLDVNRNFPANWLPDSTQSGAGPYPLSEPETRALAEWMLAHPNICGSQHYHTFSGVILRPSSVRPDDQLPRADVENYRALGEMGTAETGYPCVSVYHGFMYPDARKYGGIKGVHLDWVYDHLGVYAFSTELWNIAIKAGVEIKDFIEDMRNRSEEDDLKVLRWADTHLQNEGFIPWTPFDHPQLGPVEIGGWNWKFTHQNPPGPYAEEICHGNAMFTVRCAMAAPRLQVSQVTSETIGDGIYKVRAVIENSGFLPTWVTEQARSMGKAKPVTAELWGEGVAVATGKAKQTVGDLAGRSDQYEAFSYFPNYGNEARKAVEWVVTGLAGREVTVEAVSRNAGTARATVTLE